MRATDREGVMGPFTDTQGCNSVGIGLWEVVSLGPWNPDPLIPMTKSVLLSSTMGGI